MGLVKIIELVLDMIRRLIRKSVVLIEYTSNFLEAFVWSVRNKLVFLGLLIIVLPFCSQIISIDGAGYIFITFIIVDILVTLLNKFFQPKKRIIPFTERLFSLIPYIWIFIETTINYFDWALYFLANVMNTTFGLTNFYPVLENFIIQYTTLPGGQYLQLVFFFLFYYGIGRNKSLFPFFVRYNYVQAVLFTGISTFLCHIFMLWSKVHTVPLEIGVIAVTIYSFSTALFAFCMLSTLFGRESNIPFLHQNILYHTGLREKDGYNPLGLDEYDK